MAKEKREGERQWERRKDYEKEELWLKGMWRRRGAGREVEVRTYEMVDG